MYGRIVEENVMKKEVLRGLAVGRLLKEIGKIAYLSSGYFMPPAKRELLRKNLSEIFGIYEEYEDNAGSIDRRNINIEYEDLKRKFGKM